MSQCESMLSSLDASIKDAFNDLKSDEENCLELLEQWENDNDTDDILSNFVKKIDIKEQHFEGSTLQASLECTEQINSCAPIDIDYTIINDLHRLKHIPPDKKYNLNDIKELIEQLNDDGLLYLAGLLEYINGEYFQDFKGKVTPGKKLVLFRKLLEANVRAMQSLHDTIKEKDKLTKINKIYRVWRRPFQEEYILGKDYKPNQEIITDVFLSTSTCMKKVIEFYKNQCTAESGEDQDQPIIWEISMDKDSTHPNSQIPNSELYELVLNTGSILRFTGKHTVNEEGLSFTVKKFVYKGHSTEGSAGEFYGKSSYDDAIAKLKKPKELSSKNLPEGPPADLGPAKKLKSTRGGKNTQRKKEIMGRTRCIYKKPNDRKEYVKYKGELVTLKEFKNNFKKKS